MRKRDDRHLRHSCHARAIDVHYMCRMDILDAQPPAIVAVQRDRDGQPVLVADDGLAYVLVARRDAFRRGHLVELVRLPRRAA